MSDEMSKRPAILYTTTILEVSEYHAILVLMRLNATRRNVQSTLSYCSRISGDADALLSRDSHVLRCNRHALIMQMSLGRQDRC